MRPFQQGIGGDRSFLREDTRGGAGRAPSAPTLGRYSRDPTRSGFDRAIESSGQDRKLWRPIPV